MDTVLEDQGEEGEAVECRVAPCSIARILISPMLAFVLGLITISYLPLVVWRKHSSVHDVAHLIVFNILVSLLLVSYLMTVCTDPGAPPEWWNTRESERGNPLALRRCHKSDMLKPPRSHYCSVTRRLVLNMDHFCPWVDNTVGYYNRKFFILFLFYSCLTCLYAAVQLYIDGSLNIIEHSQEESLTASTIRLMAMMVDLSLGIALVFFASFHISMASKNETTIESCGMADPKYDLGSEANLEQVFGKKKWLWLIPIYGQGPSGNGITWPVRHLGANEGSHIFSDVHSDDSA